ncbi:MAG: sugar transferase [Candidatus Coatesbacteria bacterium]|nr:sugar transferase [Candidatus Coatesbacteria bacterium]
MAATSWQRYVFPVLQIIGDCAATSFAILITFQIRKELLTGILPYLIHPLIIYLRVIPFVIFVTVFVFALQNLYARQRNVTTFKEWISIIKGVSIVVLVIMSASFLYQFVYSRTIIIMFYAIDIILLTIVRLIFRRFRTFLLTKEFDTIRALILGTKETARIIASKMKRFPTLGYRVIGFVQSSTGLGQAHELEKLPLLGTWHHLKDIVAKHNIEEVFVADPNIPHQELLDLVSQFDSKQIKFRVVTDLFEIISSETDIIGVADTPVINLNTSTLTPTWAVIKRLFDILVSILVLIMTLPFWILVGILIKIDSKGPVIFKQKRIGLNGREFMMYKFRTMHSNTEVFAPAPSTMEDIRITRIGKFLRVSSVDEVPQIINVLKGDMSLVGPRPEMPFIVETYKPWQRKRLEVKPGLTGLWQVLGRKDLPLHENIEYDFYYIRNWSFLLDMVIIIKTIPSVLKAKGAY